MSYNTVAAQPASSVCSTRVCFELRRNTATLSRRCLVVAGASHQSHATRFRYISIRGDADRDAGATAGFEFDLQTIPRAPGARNRWLVATAYMRTDSMRSISIDMWVPRSGLRLFGRACKHSHDMVRLL